MVLVSHLTFPNDRWGNILLKGVVRCQNKGKAPTDVDIPQEVDVEETKRISQLRFWLEGMEAYYLSFKKKQPIMAEARFDVDSFKDDFLNIQNQFHIQDWEPFTIPLDPYFSKLV
ncbi:hypothetical protein HAX54_014374 [Datura stramonium]|uniref:Uncharacterized protein n=1 Tax=Datura stramonium TaxID=4076 RepID=A0ABS8TQ40_DATST|nr:hypothetical protein [Datura stramonium]